MQEFKKIRNLVLVAVWAFAGLVGSASYGDEGFYKEADFKGRPIGATILRAVQASPKMMDVTSTCGGTFISDQGHYLTALHCLKSCLFSKPQMQKLAGLYPNYLIQAVTFSADSNLTCDLAKLPDLNVKGAKVVYLGKGWTNFDEANFSYYDEDIKNKLIENYDDIAILQFPVKTAGKCSKITKTDTAVGQRLFAIGYPDSATRSNGKNAESAARRISQGAVSKSYLESEALRQIPFLPEEDVNGAIIADWNRFFARPGFVVTDLDLAPGMSGGPVFDEAGSLVAVVSAGIAGDEATLKTKYRRNSGLVISAKKVRSDVEALLGQAQANSIFSCGGN